MFEVGKKYAHPYDKGVVSLCVYVNSMCAVLEHPEKKTFSCPKIDNDSWVEVKPLTFADLKYGEKFKWVDKTIGVEGVCIKIRDGYLETEWWNHFMMRDDFCIREVVRVSEV